MTTKMLTHEKIKQRLRREVLEHWPPGTRLPSVKELARIFNYGQSSTHRAVQELAVEGLLVSRPRLGTFVAETAQSDPGPSHPRARISVIHSGGDVMLHAAIDGIKAGLSDQNVAIETILHPDMVRERGTRYPGDALIYLNPIPEIIHETLESRPAVVLSTGWEYNLVDLPTVDAVLVDGVHGGLLAGEHATEMDVDRVCFVGGAIPGRDEYDLTSANRLRGFEMAWRRTGNPVSRVHVDGYTMSHGAQAAASILAVADPPDLVVAASDDLAMGIFHGGLALGLAVGSDYQLIGFDAQNRSRYLDGGSLTSVAAPMGQMGEAAAGLLLERLDAPSRTPRRLMLAGSLRRGVSTQLLARV